MIYNFDPYDEYNFCAKAADAWRYRPAHITMLQLNCHHQEEADKVKSIMDEIFPEVKYIIHVRFK